MTPGGSATAQGAWWGVGVHDWATIQEGQVRELYDDVLDRIGASVTTPRHLGDARQPTARDRGQPTAADPGPPPAWDPGQAAGRASGLAGMRVLDVGCGSGMFCLLAAGRGAEVSGLDAAEPLLDLARERVPEGSFTLGDMERLPYADASFDLVTGMNSVHYADDHRQALREARRVTARGGRLVAATWGPPESCEASAYLTALARLLPPLPDRGGGGPFELSADGRLAALAETAGWTPEEARDVTCVWRYADLAEAQHGLLAGGPSSTRALEEIGWDRAAAIVADAIAPFRTEEGGYRMRNVFRYLVATA
ncbi:class I SAM-dependent methyltransferase [Nonomuraea sp. K274]|uniref:Class I SAM-dependent methyltransferase n=1 Tax=Nonomuraea cypriaca TaxID=1187855 RepID=A0A931ADR8_9ACTN|nr:class I SAM-dependent methyltransferase [Nonomuraea cypriaca]MBF8189750.1 class I SAM-dependent methyltransferase [Nonomuraea cypriaca]